ncbi:MAG TPA: peptidoglycan DD-metalloendopeptidase family protein [Tissierellaceae bacterium]|nr:peptidoglycan DD-metalloendopeptidase family protein [Tissierellaceae bacterium]
MKEDNSKICILIVPYTQKVKRILIPKWLPKFSLMALSLILILSSTYLVVNKRQQLKLKNQAKEYVEMVQALEKKNKEKEDRLAQLENQNKVLQAGREDVENKLDEIDALQREVERLTGTKTPSRGGAHSRTIDLDSLEPEEEMEVLCDVLDDKKLELENYVVDLKKQLNYLKTIPDLMPTHGRLTSRFGSRRDPFTGRIRRHTGIDIANSVGTSIRAAGKGQVGFAGLKSGLGRTIIINHGNGYKTVYGHNSRLLVKVGQWVEKGEVIAKMGSTGRSTGSHLHFEIHKNNVPINPYDVLK